MKVLIYDNKEKDAKGNCQAELIRELEALNVSYRILKDEELCFDESADALFAIGGDGTILFLAEYAKRNSIPIIGINVGKLGFLCEFEKQNIKEAVDLFYKNLLIKDKRLMLKITLNNDVFYALNDVYVQRIYDYNLGNMVADISVAIDNSVVSKFLGDGAIISSPTGPTAYSFSLGGPLLSPHAAAFVVTPIAAHSFNQRPIVYSAGSTCKISATGKAPVSVFIDGKHVARLDKDDFIEVSCAEKPMVFLRKSDFNFFEKLSYKLYKKVGGDFND